MNDKSEKSKRGKKVGEDDEQSEDFVVIPERKSGRTSVYQSMKDFVRKPTIQKKSKKKVEPIVEILDDSRREKDNDILRQYLGVNNYGKCLKHPDQPIIVRTEDSEEEVKTCKYCNSHDDGHRSIIQQRILQRRDWIICGLPLKQCPLFSKYFAMMELNVPVEIVQNACYIDRHHPLVLELNPDECIAMQGVPSLQANVEYANERFLLTSLEDSEKQVGRVMQRRMISAHVTAKIDEAMVQFRAKQRSTFQKGVAKLIRVNKFLGGAKRLDELLFDDSHIEGAYNNSLRMNLGMDNFGMCLRHPNNRICSRRCAEKLDPVQICRICKSEKLAGGKFAQPKQLGAINNQIQKLQKNQQAWHQRTNILYYGQDFESIHPSTRDESSIRKSIVPAKRKMTIAEWEQSIRDRVKQVQAWDAKNVLGSNPVYAKYFFLLKIGVPFDAVKETALLDGLNADVLALDPSDSLENQKDKLSADALEEVRALIPEDSTAEELENTVKVVDEAFDKRLLFTHVVKAKDEHNKVAVKKEKKEKKAKEKTEKKEKKKKEKTEKKEKKAKEKIEKKEKKKKEKAEKKEKKESTKKKKKKTKSKEDDAAISASGEEMSKTDDETRKEIAELLKSGDTKAAEKIANDMNERESRISRLEAELAKKEAMIEALQKEQQTAGGSKYHDTVEEEIDC